MEYEEALELLYEWARFAQPVNDNVVEAYGTLDELIYRIRSLEK